MTPALKAIAAFNASPDRPFDQISEGVRCYHTARLPLLARDCDYEIVTYSGVQGVRL